MAKLGAYLGHSFQEWVLGHLVDFFGRRCKKRCASRCASVAEWLSFPLI